MPDFYSDSNEEEIMSKRHSCSELLTENGAEKEHSLEKKTNWRAIYAAGALCFLAAVESSFVVMADWPYMHKIDPQATSNFYGFANSCSTIVHVIFSILFSFWTYRSHTVKKQLIVGRILAFLGCCIYLFVEFLPFGKRYQLLLCYLVFAVASSSTAILRVYIVLMSTEDDRTKAFSMVGVTGTVSVVVAPLGQLAFSGISYPGFVVFPNVFFNLYTAPVWLATITNIFAVIFVVVFLPEMHPRELKKEVVDAKEDQEYSLSALKNRWRQIKSLDVSWTLVVLCLGQRIILNMSPATIDIIAAPLLMALYGWDSEYMVIQSCILVAAMGILAIAVCSLYMGTDLSKWLPARASFLIAMLLSVTMYVVSYPWPLTSNPVPEYNETTGAGCNPSEYTWCSSASAASPYLFIPVLILVSGVGLTMGDIAIDTIYSKVLRTSDQSIMQALVVVVDDLASIVEPVYATGTFTAFGQPALWISNCAVTALGLLLWIIFYGKLKEYE